MKDIKHIIFFIVIGLGLAWAVSGPLRKPANQRPKVGTPLSASTKKPVYAEGEITLKSGIKSSSQVLFIIARPAAGGPPVAVSMVSQPRFPLLFILTTGDNMVGEDFYEGDIQVVARLDADGAAGPRQPDDLEGSATAGTSRRNIKIEIQPNP